VETEAVRYDSEKGWEILAGAGAGTSAVLETAPPLTSGNGTLEITFKPVQRFFIRVSITRSEAPVCDIPPSVGRILSTLPASRTKPEEAELETFYLSVAPALDATRRRLKRLEEDLAKQER
jgi:hypothetical protein